jgi:glycine oxidase
MLRLDAESLALWPDLAARLLTETGVDIELRRTGLLSLIETDADAAEAGRRVAWKRAHGERAELLPAEDALEREPSLAPSIRGALWMPDLAQIRNHRAAPALAAAAAKRGAVVMEHTSALGYVESGGRVTGVRTPAGDVSAGVVVLAAGAWSGPLAGTEPDTFFPLTTIPAKGQMLLLRAAPGALRHMVLASGEYLVPRADGRILAGSTVEYVGFDTSVTARGVASIASAVARMAPRLADAPVETSWAGLRPDTRDHLPILGEVRPGLVAATGHFRSGIMLAPVTAEIVRDLIDGRALRDLAPFSPSRG